jgi:apoptosis-inducing factor 3
MSWRPTGIKDGDLPEATLRGTVLGATPIVLVRLGGTIHAVAGACPHIGGDLAEGTLELGKLTCPLHGATFELETGAVKADPFGVVPPEGGVEPLPRYPVRVTEGQIEVDAPDV